MATISWWAFRAARTRTCCWLMAECVRRLPYSIKVSAAHVALDNVGYRIDTGYMARLCNHLNIPFYLLKDEVDLDNEKKKGMCFVCASMRRKMIFNLTREIGCNKLAFGHHMDDAVQTLLMNQIWHGTISAMPCSLSMLDEHPPHPPHALPRRGGRYGLHRAARLPAIAGHLPARLQHQAPGHPQRAIPNQVDE